MRIVLAVAACLAAGLICVRAQDVPVEEPEDGHEPALSEAFDPDTLNQGNPAGTNVGELVAEFLSHTTESPKAENGEESNDKSGPKPGKSTVSEVLQKVAHHLKGGQDKQQSYDSEGGVRKGKVAAKQLEDKKGKKQSDDSESGVKQQIGNMFNGAGKLPNFGNHTGLSNGTFNIGEMLAKLSNIPKMANNGNCTGGNHMTSPGFPKFDPKTIIFFMLNATCGQLFKAKWEIIKRNRTIAKDAITTEHIYISNEKSLIVSRSYVLPHKKNVVPSVSAYDFSKDDARVIHAPMNFLMPCLLSDKRGLTFSIVKDNLVAENNTHVVGNKKDYKVVSSDPLPNGEADALRDSNPEVRCLCSHRPIHRLADLEGNGEQTTDGTVQVAFVTLHSVMRIEFPVSVLMKSSNLVVNEPPELD